MAELQQEGRRGAAGDDAMPQAPADPGSDPDGDLEPTEDELERYKEYMNDDPPRSESLKKEQMRRAKRRAFRNEELVAADIPPNPPPPEAGVHSCHPRMGRRLLEDAKVDWESSESSTRTCRLLHPNPDWPCVSKCSRRFSRACCVPVCGNFLLNS